tara:strand:+ start:603 stop:1364 length:762 start_codon:yes stop_codon:yes gene_type:complete
MDFKEIKGQRHYLFEDFQEFQAFMPNTALHGYWRDGHQNDWVELDDGCICQVLKRFKVKDHKGIKSIDCIRTVCGTYRVDDKNRQMLGKEGISENIYSFSGNTESKRRFQKDGKGKEMLFARYVASGMESKKAYALVYPKASSKKYINEKVNQLLKSEKVLNMVSKEIKSTLAELGISNEWILERYRDMVDIADRPSDILRSLDSLAKIAGLFDTEKKQESLTVWSGFSPEQVEALKSGDTKTKLIGHAEKEE